MRFSFCLIAAILYPPVLVFIKRRCIFGDLFGFLKKREGQKKWHPVKRVPFGLYNDSSKIREKAIFS
jgi:hypothetical protein